MNWRDLPHPAYTEAFRKIFPDTGEYRTPVVLEPVTAFGEPAAWARDATIYEQVMADVLPVDIRWTP